MRLLLSLVVLLTASGRKLSTMAALTSNNCVPARYLELCKPSDVVRKSSTMWEVTGGKSLEVYLHLNRPTRDDRLQPDRRQSVRYHQQRLEPSRNAGSQRHASEQCNGVHKTCS